jgi:hypothetical protein
MLNCFDLQINTDLKFDMAALLGAKTPNFYSQGILAVPDVIFAFDQHRNTIDFLLRRTCRIHVLMFAGSIIATSKATQSSTRRRKGTSQTPRTSRETIRCYRERFREAEPGLFTCKLRADRDSTDMF